MSSMTEVEIASLGLDSSSDTPVLILREKEGDRLLPIWIGPGEANAIARRLAGISYSRPLTHDLFHSVIQGLGASLSRVLITKVEDNTFYATLVLDQDGEVVTVDARPSDSVALAVRAEAPIFAADDLLELVSVDIQEAELGGMEGEEAAWKSEAEAEASFEIPESGAAAAGGGGGEEEESPPGEESEPLSERLKGLDPEDFGRYNP